MPFIEPFPTTKNQARYKTIDCSDDFILQEHRYSLRKSRHLYWVRIITRGIRPRLKVAHAFTERDIRAREWKYISEDLPKGMPESLASLPPGNTERVQWLLDRLLSVRTQLGEDENDVDEDEYLDEDYDGEHDLEHEEVKDPDGPSFNDNEFESSSVASLEFFSQAPVVEKKRMARRPKSDDFTDRIPSLLLTPVAIQGNPTPKSSSRFAFFNNLRGRNNSKSYELQNGAEYDTNGVALTPSSSTSSEPLVLRGDTARTSSNLRNRTTALRFQSDERSIASTDYESSDEGGGCCNGDLPNPPPLVQQRKLARQGSSIMGNVFVAQPAPFYAVQAKQLKVQAQGLVLAGLNYFGMGKYAQTLGIPENLGQSLLQDDQNLPSYLFSQSLSDTESTHGISKGKKETLTMEKLKREHERKSMLKGVVAVTFLSFVIRMVSFDAFLLILIGMNIAVCYGIHNRHSLVKEFAKNSIRRRVKFTKQVWNARWGKSKSSTSVSGNANTAGGGAAQISGPSLGPNSAQLEIESSPIVGNSKSLGTSLSTPKKQFSRSGSQTTGLLLHHQGESAPTMLISDGVKAQSPIARSSSATTKLLKRITPGS